MVQYRLIGCGCVARGKYYLLGRNNSTNKFETVDIDYGKIYREDYDYQSDNNSLQDIDLFTMKFTGIDEFKRYLNANSNEFFIVCKNNDETTYYPVIYNNDQMSSALKKMAMSQKDDSLDSIYVDIILDEFTSKLYSDINFYKFIAISYPDLYIQFINCFKNYKTSNNLWSNSTYPIFRQIVESFSKYQQYTNCFDNLENKKVDFLDNKYDPKKDNNIRSKINYILDFVKNLKHDSIIVDKNVFIINSDYISCDSDISEILNSIDPRFKRLLYLISNCSFVNEYETEKYNEIEESLNNKLVNYLRKDINLNIVYAFVLLYNKCKIERENMKYGKK